MTDLFISNEGSLYGFRANTEAGDNFLDECASDDWQWLGKTLYVDHRCAGPLAEAAIADGLEVA